MTLLERLAGLELLVVTGKGGVGKSVVSASLGTLIAGTGRRVLVLEVDPRESLYELLAVAPSGGEIVAATPRVHVQNLNPRTVLDQVVRERLRMGFLADRVLASPVYGHFAEAAPGLKEIAVLGHAFRLVTGRAGSGAPEIDMVILDAPATGHGVSLLAAPGLVSDVIRDGPVGHMARELAQFVGDPKRCGIAVVTLAEEMPVREALETLEAVAERLHRRPETLVVNGLYPPVPPAVAADPRSPVLSLWERRRRVNEEELLRLREVWSGPRAELPLLPHDGGPALVAALGRSLERSLTSDAEDSRA